MATVEPLGPGPDRAARARAGDALELPRLRDERDRRAGAAGRARRPQAGAPARALRDARGRPAAEPRAPQVRPRGRRRDGLLPPARRPVDLRHARAAGAALLDALPARRRPGQLREHRRLPGCGDALHGVPARAPGHRDAPRHRRGHRRLQAELRRVAPRARGAAGAPAEPAAERLGRDRGRHGDEHAAAQSRRGGRRARGDDRRADDRRRPADEAHQGPGLPDRRDRRSAAKGSARPTARAVAGS